MAETCSTCSVKLIKINKVIYIDGCVDGPLFLKFINKTGC
jgi:hypothetical protein